MSFRTLYVHVRSNTALDLKLKMEDVEALQARYADIQEEMNSYLDQKDRFLVDIEREVHALHTTRTQFPSYTHHLSNMTTCLDHGSSLASEMTQQIRSIDIRRHAISTCMVSLHQYVQLKQCAADLVAIGVDPLASLVPIATYRRLQLAGIQNSKWISEDLKVIEKRIEEIQEIVLQALHSSSDLNLDSVRMYFPVLQGLELQQEGVQVVLTECEKHLEKCFIENLILEDIIDITREMCNTAASSVTLFEKEMRCFENVFGNSRLVVNIHETCQEKIIGHLKTYLVSSNVKTLVMRMKTEAFPTQESEMEAVMIQVEDMLNECATLLQYIEKYDRFLQTCVQQEEIPKQFQIVFPTRLNIASAELVEVFASLETGWLNMSTKRALEWEEYNVESGNTSFVEECFFIARTVLDRALATGNVECVGRILQLIHTTLDTNLMVRFQEQSTLPILQAFYPRHYLVILPEEKESILNVGLESSNDLQRQVQNLANMGKSMQRNVKNTALAAVSGVEVPRPKQSSSLKYGKQPSRITLWKSTVISSTSPTTIINNVDKSVIYYTKMSVHMMQQIHNVFPKSDDEQADIPTPLHNGITALQAFPTQCSAVKEQVILRISRILQSRMALFLSSSLLSSNLEDCPYDLNEFEFEENQANDPFAKAYITHLHEMLTGLKVCLHKESFGQLLVQVATCTAELILSGMEKHEFTALGGLQLDKDIRIVLSYFVSNINELECDNVSPRDVRHAFRTLHQSAALLNLDELEEVYEIYQSSFRGVQWSIDANTVRKWLLKRIEFATQKELIHALRL